MNEGQTLTPGWKLGYMKNQFTHNTTKSLSLHSFFFFLPSFIPIFPVFHLQCVIVLTKRTCTCVNVGDDLIPTSNTSDITGSDSH